ncbi:MAG: hypothetical protein P4L55_15160 [Syntrophobacteraceae bacterium]|nr:hypothetical protein [Syntrophobacteraceae bacterium]
MLTDLLIEDLWPDTAYDSGKRNLRVVLHRLQRILGSLSKSRSRYISYEMSAISLNRGLVRLDIDEFLVCCKCAREAEQTGDVKRSIDFGNSAIALYKGEYLEEERGTAKKRPST